MECNDEFHFFIGKKNTNWYYFATDFKEVLPSSSQEANSSALSTRSGDDTVVLQIVSCNSDDAIILEESDSPSMKQQRADEEAKRVRW